VHGDRNDGGRCGFRDARVRRQPSFQVAHAHCLYVVERGRALYVVERGRALRADIHHPHWPLQPANATVGLNTIARPLGLELDSDPLLHYSARQDTLIWALEAA
jgi:Uncharacterized conserved protein (COG2071)